MRSCYDDAATSESYTPSLHDALPIFHHLLDVAVAEAARGLDADLLLLVGRLVLGLDVDDAVGVDVEGRSEEHTSELQSQSNVVCRLLLEKKNTSDRGFAKVVSGAR